MLGCCDVIIATRNASIGMGGPAMIEGGGLGVYHPAEVGPVSFQSPNGVIDMLVEDEAEATARRKNTCRTSRARSPSWKAPDQRLLRRAIPENRLRVYDIRNVIDSLADEGSVLEIRRDFGVGIVTALVRIEGEPFGLIANNRSISAAPSTPPQATRRFAVKATVEAVIPIGLGAAAGLGAASWLIATFGPPGPVAPSARTVSITWAVAAGAAGLVVLGVVSGVSFIRTFEVHSLKRRLAWVPWEIVPIVGSLFVLSRLNAGGALIEDTGLDILRPSALLLVFPVLFVAGFATLGARILVEVLRRTGGRASSRSPVTYLAFHRLTGLPKLTVLFVGASALCLGIFIDSQTMVGSLRSTVDAKAGVFVGSDVQVLIDSNAPEQEVFPLPITRATRVKYAGTMLPGEVPFDLVGIDPETIVGAAFWDDAFSDESLEDLVARLPSQSGPLPALLVQGEGDPTADRDRADRDADRGGRQGDRVRGCVLRRPGPGRGCPLARAPAR